MFGLPNEILTKILKKLHYRDALNYCALDSKMNQLTSKLDGIFSDIFDTSLYTTVVDDSVMIMIPGPILGAFVDNININGLYHIHLWKSGLGTKEYKFAKGKDIRNVTKEYFSDFSDKEGIGFFICDFDKLLKISDYCDKDTLDFIFDYVMGLYDDENKLHKHDLGSLYIGSNKKVDGWGHWDDFDFDLYEMYKIHKKQLAHFFERF